MESIKMPFLPQETLRTQRVEVYLNDLKARLKQLRHQHDEVIQHSVDIIKEIDGVSSSLLTPPNVEEQNEQITKIKKLIQEFETAKNTASPKSCTTPPAGLEGAVDIRKILDNFEKLNESHVLKESLVLFKRAKESFEKIDTFLDKMANSEEGSGSEKANGNVNMAGSSVSPSLRLKINLFSGNHNGSTDDPSYYASCCNSLTSMENNFSTEEVEKEEKHEPSKKINTSHHVSERGYEGDNDDSEYDLFAAKKKKTKSPSQNT